MGRFGKPMDMGGRSYADYFIRLFERHRVYVSDLSAEFLVNRFGECLFVDNLNTCDFILQNLNTNQLSYLQQEIWSRVKTLRGGRWLQERSIQINLRVVEKNLRTVVEPIIISDEFQLLHVYLNMGLDIWKVWEELDFNFPKYTRSKNMLNLCCLWDLQCEGIALDEVDESTIIKKQAL